MIRCLQEYEGLLIFWLWPSTKQTFYEYGHGPLSNMPQNLFFCFNFLRLILRLYGMFLYSNTHSIEQCRGKQKRKNEMRWSEFPWKAVSVTLHRQNVWQIYDCHKLGVVMATSQRIYPSPQDKSSSYFKYNRRFISLQNLDVISFSPV